MTPLYHSSANVDWTSATAYDSLRLADRNAFAWEWLRRTDGYREAWRQFVAGSSSSISNPKQFGLERFENPALPVPVARPVWSAKIDPSVIRAVVLDPFARPADRIDLWRLLPLVTLAIDDDQIEHLLLSNGIQSVRIDIAEGTLIGNPTSLQYCLQGIAELHGSMAALQRLIRIVKKGGFGDAPMGSASRRDRWILELRAGDALLGGASHQDIARGLFGNSIADARWREHSPSLRQQVLRLARAARAHLATPLDRRWFDESGTTLEGR